MAPNFEFESTPINDNLNLNKSKSGVIMSDSNAPIEMKIQDASMTINSKLTGSNALHMLDPAQIELQF